MKSIAIFGAGGHFKVIADAIEKQGVFEIDVVVDDRRAGEVQLGRKVCSRDEFAAKGLGYGVVAIGDNFKRSKVAREIGERFPGFKFVSVIHPSASVARGAVIGDGAVVFAGAIVGPDARVGAHAIVNHGAQIDHDCVVGDFATLGPGAVLGGAVELGEYSSVLLGANVIHAVRIGAHTVVGAGATVLEDLPSHSVCFGAPAKKSRSRKEDEPYL